MIRVRGDILIMPNVTDFTALLVCSGNEEVVMFCR